MCVGGGNVCVCVCVCTYSILCVCTCVGGGNVCMSVGVYCVGVYVYVCGGPGGGRVHTAYSVCIATHICCIVSCVFGQLW